MDSGPRGICPLCRTSAHCWRIAAWPTTRSRCRTCSISHRTFLAALRLPATIAAIVLLVGPLLALELRRKKRHFEATLSVAYTMAIFLIPAHIAFVRFTPMLSSEPMAATIDRIAGYPASESPADPAAKQATLIVYGDQTDGACIMCSYARGARRYWWQTAHPRCCGVRCGRMCRTFSSTTRNLSSIWGTGERKFLFAQAERRDQIEGVLGKRLICPIQELNERPPDQADVEEGSP